MDNHHVVNPIITRVFHNVDEMHSAQAKQILKDLSEALIVLFVNAEPKLIDNTIPMDKKVGPFFKAIMKLGLEGAEAWALKGKRMEAFENKLAKFKNLEHSLTLITK